MSGVLQWGPFVIRLDWFYYGLSALLGFVIAKTIIKRKSEFHLSYLDYLFNGMLVALLVWKISPVFSDLRVLKNPIALFVYPGTSTGIWLGCLAAILYLAYIKRKKQMSWRTMLDVFSVLLISFVFVYSITHWQYGNQTALPWAISLSDPAYKYHPVNVYQAVLLIPLIWVVFKSHIGEGTMAFFNLAGYGISVIIVSLLKPKLYAVYGLSIEQWTAIVFIVLGAVAQQLAANKADDRNKVNS